MLAFENDIKKKKFELKTKTIGKKSANQLGISILSENMKVSDIRKYNNIYFDNYQIIVENIDRKSWISLHSSAQSVLRKKCSNVSKGVSCRKNCVCSKDLTIFNSYKNDIHRCIFMHDHENIYIYMKAFEAFLFVQNINYPLAMNFVYGFDGNKFFYLNKNRVYVVDVSVSRNPYEIYRGKNNLTEIIQVDKKRFWIVDGGELIEMYQSGLERMETRKLPFSHYKPIKFIYNISEFEHENSKGHNKLFMFLDQDGGCNIFFFNKERTITMFNVPELRVHKTGHRPDMTIDKKKFAIHFLNRVEAKVITIFLGKKFNLKGIQEYKWVKERIGRVFLSKTAKEDIILITFNEEEKVFKMSYLDPILNQTLEDADDPITLKSKANLRKIRDIIKKSKEKTAKEAYSLENSEDEVSIVDIPEELKSIKDSRKKKIKKNKRDKDLKSSKKSKERIPTTTEEIFGQFIKDLKDKAKTNVKFYLLPKSMEDRLTKLERAIYTVRKNAMLIKDIEAQTSSTVDELPKKINIHLDLIKKQNQTEKIKKKLHNCQRFVCQIKKERTKQKRWYKKHVKADVR